MSPNNQETSGVRREETTGADDFAAVDERGDAPERIEVKVTDRRRVSAEADADFETDDEDRPPEAAPGQGLEEMRLKLQESEGRRLAAERNAEELADRFRKAQVQLRAENDEVRARLQRTFDQKLEAARGDLVLSLLDTLDNLQRAIAVADAGTEQNYEALRGGVKATAEMFEAQLKKLGLQKVASEGEVFNPEVHEAVEMAIVPPDQDSLVLAELRPGYRFGERLLRPAQVRVGRGSES
jgi:molecular chaperone GrpE